DVPARERDPVRTRRGSGRLEPAEHDETEMGKNGPAPFDDAPGARRRTGSDRASGAHGRDLRSGADEWNLASPFPPPPPTFTGAEIEALYIEHRPVLHYVAAVKFRIPDADAEALVHEAMISLLTTRDTIVNVRAWLIAAVCNGSRHYWRCRAHLEVLPRDLEEILYSRELVSDRQRLDSDLIMRQALARLR